MKDIYLRSLYVYSNYVDKNLLIDLTPEKGKKFKHLILTGRNGSGKTTTLNALYHDLIAKKAGFSIAIKNSTSPRVEGRLSATAMKDKGLNLLLISIPSSKKFNVTPASNKQSVSLKDIYPIISDEISARAKEIKDLKTAISNNQSSLTTTFDPKIKSINKNVIQAHKLKISSLENLPLTSKIELPSSSIFQQFLVDKKREQAYAIADEDEKLAVQLKAWFNNLEKTLRTLFEEPLLKLKHKLRDSSFYFELPNNRTFTLNELADGYGSVLLMLSEIMMQIEAFKLINDITTEPSGIVLIDEIEAHLHLSLQEKILPTLVKAFPKLQFIVCSHSPQVIASIENCNVYDLTSKRLTTDFLGGISYDVLSKSHFGIASEYSIKVTKLLDKAKKLLRKTEKTEKEDQELAKIYGILKELSPELTNELFLYFNMKRA